MLKPEVRETLQDAQEASQPLKANTASKSEAVSFGGASEAI